MRATAWSFPIRSASANPRKPQAYQFSLHQLAANTHALLASIGVERPIIIGHSMGGMLAMRYALMYPRETAGLVVVNPIGLEDWKAKGVPFATIDQLYERELKTSFESIKKYQLSTYYAGEWKPAIRSLGEHACGHVRGRGRQAGRVEPGAHLRHDPRQPVIHEIDQISVPTVLMIGQKDTTAIGKDRAPPELAKTLGNYPDLAARRTSASRDRCLCRFRISATRRSCRTRRRSTRP